MKNIHAVCTPSWKLGMPLARWHAKLNNWHTFGLLARLLARWHAFRTLAYGHVNHASTNDTCGTRFSKFSYALWKCKITWPWKLQLTLMIWRRYIISSSKRSLSRCGLLDHILYDWRLVRHYFEWVWVILGEWKWVGHYFGWVEGEWGWVEVSGDGCIVW